MPRHGPLKRRRSPRMAMLAALGAVAAASAAAPGALGAGVPRERRAPVISGTAVVGQRLSASHGSWSPRPRAYRYAWKRCDARGRHCRTIPHAASSRYTLRPRDVGATLRVAVAALDAGGASKPTLSAHTAVVKAALAAAPLIAGPVRHLEYVFNDGPVSVYDIDKSFALVETFTLPGTTRGVRGVAVSPGTHVMFVSYGGDGGGNGNGSVLAYDLVGKRVLWSVDLATGVDSGAVSPDGKLLYMPDGELSPNGDWYIMDASSGSVLGKIETPGTGPHDGVMSADGQLLQLGDRNYPHLLVYNTQTRKLLIQAGALVGGVRPNTLNAGDSLSFTTATGFDGFQVSSLTQPGMPVLFTESFGGCSGPFSTCSHGISLSPDNRAVYVIDTVHKAVQAWDVHGAAEGVAPVHVATIPVEGLEGKEQGCAYDCGRDGWLHHSLDGRYVFVGDSGDVIETATNRVVARIDNLLNTRKFLEIDWQNGVPVASSGRQGIGSAR